MQLLAIYIISMLGNSNDTCLRNQKFYRLVFWYWHELDRLFMIRKQQRLSFLHNN